MLGVLAHGPAFVACCLIRQCAADEGQQGPHLTLLGAMKTRLGRQPMHAAAKPPSRSLLPWPEALTSLLGATTTMLGRQPVYIYAAPNPIP